MNTLLFSFLLCTSGPAATPPADLAAVEPLITRSFVAAGRIDLTIANLEKEVTVVKLTSLSTDETLFRQRITNHNGYSVSLCLKEVPEGRYVISVEKGDTLRRQVVLKTETGVLCSDWK